MVWHIFGWTDVVVTVISGVGVARWLYHTARYPYSWTRPVRAPELIDPELFVIHGDDYLGLV